MKYVLLIALLFAGAVSAQPLDRWITIINDTNVTMTDFYASNRDQSNWGRDWFGSGAMLFPSSQVDFNLDDGTGYCIWDLKAVFADGEELTNMGYNVCELGSWRIY